MKLLLITIALLFATTAFARQPVYPPPIVKHVIIDYGPTEVGVLIICYDREPAPRNWLAELLELIRARVLGQSLLNRSNRSTR